MAVHYGPRSFVYETLSFTYTDSTLTITGNNTSNVNIFKTSGSGSWDKQAYCSTPFTAPCTIEFNKMAGAGDNGTSYAMISWNADPTSDANYSSLDWASFPYQTSAYSVYNNGTQVVSSGVWDTSKKFYLVYDLDGYIRHYNGSTLLASFNKGTGQTVYVDSSYYSVDATSTYSGFSNIRVTKRSWNGTDYT